MMLERKRAQKALSQAKGLGPGGAAELEAALKNFAQQAKEAEADAEAAPLRTRAADALRTISLTIGADAVLDHLFGRFAQLVPAIVIHLLRRCFQR